MIKSNLVTSGLLLSTGFVMVTVLLCAFLRMEVTFVR